MVIPHILGKVKDFSVRCLAKKKREEGLLCNPSISLFPELIKIYTGIYANLNLSKQ